MLTERASADRRLLCLDGGRRRLRGEVVSQETHTHTQTVEMLSSYVGGGIAILR